VIFIVVFLVIFTGKDFVYYIRTLSVTLGRKTSQTDDVDVDLGKSKSVSRRCVCAVCVVLL
jgi:hypothetical protein